MTTLLDPIVEFRDDHRAVRDGLLQLVSAAKTGDLEGARESLGQLNVLTGPHFRYEEEALYPTLREYLGEYVDQLLSEHDKTISTAQTAADLLGRPALSRAEWDAIATAARALLVHVTNCDGLNILTERLSSERIDSLARSFDQARVANVPLLEWAATIRER